MHLGGNSRWVLLLNVLGKNTVFIVQFSFLYINVFLVHLILIIKRN